MVNTLFTVERLLTEGEKFGLRLKLLAGSAGLTRNITTNQLHRPGLALVGHFFHHHPERIQVLGETEIAFILKQKTKEAKQVLKEFATHPDLPCFIVTKNLAAPATIIDICNQFSIPLLSTPVSTSELLRQATHRLTEVLAPKQVVHGVMVDVFGVGVLIQGPSGIGKSECALELVLKGHRLVADDMVEIVFYPPDRLLAQGVEVIKHHMEIRGLGIINVQDLYGVAAVRDNKRLELVVHLEHWDPQASYDRIGAASRQVSFLGIDVESVTIPIRPGRGLAEIIEVAARNRLLKYRGVDSAQRFQAQLLQRIAANQPQPKQEQASKQTRKSKKTS